MGSFVIGLTSPGRRNRALGRRKDELMAYVLAQPQAMAAAAADIAGIGLAINEADAAAAGPTTGVLEAAADEVSASTATLFNSYAQEYQAVIRRAGAFHNEFAQLLAAVGTVYAETGPQRWVHSPHQPKRCWRR
jgi:PE family